ncbi:MAG: AMP-binding protein, partial [Stackebrandtia sp.]
MSIPFTPWPEAVAAEYRERGLWSGEPFGALLERLAFEHGDRVAVTDGENWLSYVSLLDRSLRVAAGLSGIGLRRGDIAVVQSANTCEYLVALFALFRLGVAPVCALPAHREAEIGYFCGHTGAVAYLHPGGP